MNTTNTIDFKTRAFGRGAFTKAYMSVDGTKVKLISTCPVKEASALFGLGSDMFPPIVQIASNTYIMDYYPRCSSLKNSLLPDQWAMYKELCALYDYARYGDQPKCNDDCFDYWIALFDTLKNKEVKEVLKNALIALGDYGTDFCFEICPRNVAVKDGKLVLLDVFFSAKALGNIYGCYK